MRASSPIGSATSPRPKRWWRRALDRGIRRSAASSSIWPSVLDARGRSGEALPHYRRYLELVARHGRRLSGPAPHEVVAVVVKFGDALAREGQPDVARTQYDLAIRMARQTGLTDLEALARQRRAALGP